MRVDEKDKYKITIITATYNSAITLEQTIVSVAAQDYPNIEYIIVDGASTDGTVDVIKKYEEQINIRWISEPDTGIYDAFNKGIDMATGDYIQFIGSDDSLCDTHTIFNVVEQLDDNTDILSAAVIVVAEDTSRQAITYNHDVLDKDAYRGVMVPHQGMFVKTSLIKNNKFDTSLKIAADYKFFLQCYYNDNVKFKYIDTPVVFFANSGSSSDLSKCWDEYNFIYRELGLPFHAPLIDSKFFIRRVVKSMLWKMGLLPCATQVGGLCSQWIKRHFIWDKHTCDNPICRWCGRV